MITLEELEHFVTKVKVFSSCDTRVELTEKGIEVSVRLLRMKESIETTVEFPWEAIYTQQGLNRLYNVLQEQVLVIQGHIRRSKAE